MLLSDKLVVGVRKTTSYVLTCLRINNYCMLRTLFSRNCSESFENIKVVQIKVSINLVKLNVFFFKFYINFVKVINEWNSRLSMLVLPPITRLNQEFSIIVVS